MQEYGFKIIFHFLGFLRFSKAVYFIKLFFFKFFISYFLIVHQKLVFEVG